MLGPDASFREGQWEAVEAVVRDRRRVLVVQRTGWGKSIVYFIATRLLRDLGAGPTLLVSPLLSLMRNQMLMSERIGIRALTMNSSNVADWDAIETELEAGRCDVLLVAPERLANERFRTQTLPLLRPGIGLFVVDEAHCISDWGHDFRPDYRRIVNIVRNLPATVPVLGTTATANDWVVADIGVQLGPGLVIQRGPLARSSLRLQAITLADQAERLAWLAEQLPALPGSGIVYCLTVADCERVSGWLATKGIDAPAYHSDRDPDARVDLEQRLLGNRLKALVATVALGMGFDKPDLGFVVHFQRPGSVVAYYQQIGRAGRAVDDAPVVLLNGAEDDDIQDYFIRSAFPGAEAMAQVADTLANSEGMTNRELQQHVNLPHSRLDNCLKLLEVDGAVTRAGTKYVRTFNPWQPDIERSRRVTEQRRHELMRMQAFVQERGCLMEFLARELDDPAAASCGRCSGCAGDFLPRTVRRDLVLEALTFLKRSDRRIEPRKQWPIALPDRKLTIPEDARLAEGRALCFYGDAGWGRMVIDGKYRQGRFADELVDAAARLIREDWQPDPPPDWVTAVPSIRRPELVRDFAERLAARLRLPFRPALRKSEETRQQKEMRNSYQQWRNVDQVIEVEPEFVSDGPVLLVDDVFDSRWTFTVCGVKLRGAGAGVVHPFALADASRFGGAN
jgi:ATP-dependent DNA helicase RecQ